MQLSGYAEALAYDIAFWLAATKDATYELSDLGGVCLDLSDKLRTAAILGLVGRSDVNLFTHNLIRSGMAWEVFLDRCRAERGEAQHHFVAGRLAPLCDALAGGEFELAARIGRKSPAEFRPGHEYEDDFHLAKALDLLGRQPADTVLNRHVDALEAFVGAGPVARVQVCRALIAKDADAFHGAFEALLDEREAEIEAAKARGQLEEPPIIAQRRIYIEGVAILRLADRLGIQTVPEFRMCPSIARAQMKRPFPGE